MRFKKLLLTPKVLCWAFVLLPINSFAQGCFQSSVITPSPFMGNNGEIFKLGDGSIWEVKYEYEYLYEYYPSVIICPSKGKLIIGDKSLNIEMIYSAARKENGLSASATIIESRIDGDFEGFEGETIIKLMNGQIWQQYEYWYHYHYSFMPKVFIYKKHGGSYKIKIDGIDKSVGVTRLH